MYCIDVACVVKADKLGELFSPCVSNLRDVCVINEIVFIINFATDSFDGRHGLMLDAGDMDDPPERALEAPSMLKASKSRSRRGAAGRRKS